MCITGVINLMFCCQCSKGEKTAARADKRKQQPAACQRILLRCSKNKAKRHQRVKEKIERNIKKAARVGKLSAPRQRTVVVRLGTDRRPGTWWPGVLGRIARSGLDGTEPVVEALSAR